MNSGSRLAWSLADRDAGNHLCPVAIVASAGEKLLCRFKLDTGNEADLMGPVHGASALGFSRRRGGRQGERLSR